MRVLHILVIFLITIPAFAGTPLKSAHREPGVSYLNYMWRAKLFSEAKQQPTTSAQDSAVQFGSRDLAKAAAWESEAVMLARFKQLRDERWLQTSDHPGFPRRSSWMYPDDGCFARAALAIMNLLKWRDPAPSKVFVFGNLNVKTTNAPDGEVSWWYHVAPIVEVANQKYVLDPAIEPSAPIKLEDWLGRMADNATSLQVAICGSGSYTPDSDCGTASDGVESAAASDQLGYLDLEWERMLELKRDPQQVLGDNPPWLAAKSLLATLF